MFRTKTNLFINKAIDLNKRNLSWATGKPKEDKNISDLAFLIHGVYNRVSSRPSFTKISRLLYKVADKISDTCNAERKILRDRAKKRLQSIRHSYFERKYSKELKILRKLWNKIRRLKKYY